MKHIVILGKPHTGSYKTTMPRAFVKALGMQPGDGMNVELEGKKIIFTPIAGPIRQDKPATGAEQTPLREECH